MNKQKMILDPDADGSQWLYRGCIVQDQTHPKLLKYACYSDENCNHLIDVCNSQRRAKQIIDDYLKTNKQ